MADSSDQNNNSPPHHRRSSFAGQTFADIFGAGKNRTSNASDNTQNNPTYNGPITSAAVEARRRVSLNTAGLSSSVGSNNTFGGRRGSIASTNSASIDESAIEDDNSPGQTQPATPFGRRLSFGARALRDVRSNTGSGGTGVSPNGEGFNWADNFRHRAERSSSISSAGGTSPNIGNHVRAKSVATMQPPPSEVPKPNVPDHFQERILKGDFYMD